MAEERPRIPPALTDLREALEVVGGTPVPFTDHDDAVETIATASRLFEALDSIPTWRLLAMKRGEIDVSEEWRPIVEAELERRGAFG